MRARRAGAVVEVGTYGMLMMIMRVLALMHMAVYMFAAIRVLVDMFMRPGKRRAMTVLMFIAMAMRVAMHRAVLMNMRMLMPITTAFNTRLTRATTTHRTHVLSPVLTTRFRFP